MIKVYVGYERGTRLQVLFVGDTTAVSSAFELPEIVTTLECSDGYKYVAQKFASLSFAPGTKVRTVIDQIAEAYQIDLVEFAISDDLVYGEGFEQAGSLSRALDKATKLANLQWSIQNNQLQIIPINGAIVEEPYIVNADTGMIGIPQRYTSIRSDLYEVGPAVGWKVTTFLNPQILPGARINLSSVYLGMQGIFRVETIRHNGDIFGPQWISNLEVTQLNT